MTLVEADLKRLGLADYRPFRAALRRHRRAFAWVGGGLAVFSAGALTGVLTLGRR